MKETPVLRWFGQIAQIPRTSGQEQAISDWLVQAARQMGLQAHQDQAYNVVIKKGQGTPVILQGHLDMVGEKETGSSHDFLRDPIRLQARGEDLYAQGTTLGADNGIALAMALALLEDDDPTLPALEVLMTTGEEVGLAGARALDGGLMDGKMLINLDAEEEGVFFTSCAGGQTVRFTLPMAREPQPVQAVRVRLDGLRGGHSGLEIDKGRLNGLLELAKLLRDGNVRLIGFEAPGKFNAISRQAGAVIAQDSLAQVKQLVDERLPQWQQQEKEAAIRYEEAPAAQPYAAEDAQRFLTLLADIPNGVYTMSADLPGLVESSVNAGLVEESGDQLILTASIRSSDPAKMQQIEADMRRAAQKAGAQVEISGAYPGWAFEKQNPLREHAVRLWQEMFGAEPKITAVHGGLECGILKSKYPDVLMLSIGPTLRDVHTPNEHVSMPSVERVYDFLKQLLRELKPAAAS